MAVETKKKSMCFSYRKRRKMAELAIRNNNSNNKTTILKAWIRIDSHNFRMHFYVVVPTTRINNCLLN